MILSRSDVPSLFADSTIPEALVFAWSRIVVACCFASLISAFTSVSASLSFFCPCSAAAKPSDMLLFLSSMNSFPLFESFYKLVSSLE